MVGGELLQLSVAQAVETAVAAVHPEVALTVVEQCHEGCSHVGLFLVGTATGIDRLVNRLQPVVHGLFQVARGKTLGEVVEEELQILQDYLAGYLASIVSSHTVGHSNHKAVEIVGG